MNYPWYSFQSLAFAMLVAVTPCLVALALTPARAAEHGEGNFTPRISGEVVIEVENDWTYQSDDPGAELNDLFTTTEPVIVLEFLPGFSIFIHGVLEPVMDPGPNESRTFEDHGLLVEELHLDYAGDGFALTGGKITPAFGTAWDAAPGVYGVDFAEDYELAENIGFGGSLTFDRGEHGSHTLSATTFFVDTSALSGSVIENRGRTTRAAGGVANTGDFQSFAVALDGGEIAALADFSYHLAVVRRAAGATETTDEIGVAIGAQYPISVGEFEISPLLEYVHFFDADGMGGQDRGYLTTSVEIAWQNWNLALSRTGRDTYISGAPDVDDELYQVSAGYAFDFGLTADVGWKFTEEGGIDSQVLGALFTYTFEF